MLASMTKGYPQVYSVDICRRYFLKSERIFPSRSFWHQFKVRCNFLPIFQLNIGPDETQCSMGGKISSSRVFRHNMRYDREGRIGIRSSNL